jgi:predicted permease
MEKGYRQWVSGWMFGAFGLKPALGRLLTESDDLKPDSHPYAVLSYDYWSRRFGRDPNVIGKTMKVGKLTLEIVGVCEPGFTGTETGTLTDFWVSTMMNGRAINNPNWGWFRTWVKLRDGASIDQIREKLQASMTNFRREKSKDFKAHGMSQQQIDRFVNSRLQVEPSFAGVSGMQKQYKRPLGVLAVVVLLVLLIACANVANLMAAQATARAREMALRVSIGAGRLRLLQLVLVESGIVAALAMVIGGLFAIWAAPFVVSMINPPDNPARLILPADWRVMGFAGALTLVITALFGTMPAFRASGVKPMSVLRGGESPRSRHRIMQLLTAAQMAFCVLVLFVTGLFITTFRKVSNQPTGFEPKDVLTLEMAAKAPQPYEHWDQVTDHLRSLSGVQSAAICSWPLMSGNGWTGGVFIGGQPRHDGGPEPYFLGVGQGWIDAMKIQWIDGRDLRREDVYPRSVIVNESFAKRFFNGENPVGRTFGVMEGKTLIDATVVGYVKDARYRNMREAIRPTVYGPYRTLDKDGALNKNDWGTLVVRMPSGMDPLAMASRLREEVKAARPEFRVSEVNTQEELVRSHLVRERLLAVLSSFFAVVALALAGIGLFGVIQYSMLQRRREIGIRMALGARAADVARRVTAQSFLMLTLGAVAGLSIGLATSQYIETLLFEVKAQDASMLSTPALVLLATAIAAAIPPVIQAVRLDPASMLRTE